MTNTLASLDQQIADLAEKLRLIERRKSEFVLSTDVPLQLVREEEQALAKLSELRGRRARLQEIPCPYRGLEYFDAEHAANYFGRQAMVQKLVDKVAERNFIAVVGPSGSGKSSLVRAGLIPALKKGGMLFDGTRAPEGSTDWQVHILTPTAHPLEALATELTRDSDSVTTTARLIDDLAQEPRSLALFLSRANSKRHSVLVVDQFEELFTLCRDEFDREAFIDNLLNLVSPDQSKVTLIITLRADFYAHLAQYPELREVVAQQQEL